MGHGTPDWGMAVKADIYSLVDDLAELPPRLGMPASIDRRGSVLLMETFDTGGHQCLALNPGNGETTGLSATAGRYGRFTYRLSRIATVASQAGVYLWVAAVVSDKMGVEVHFAASGGDPDLRLFLMYQSGDTRYDWGLRWDTANEKAYIGTDAVAWTQVSGAYPFWLQGGLTHIMKLVTDSEDFTYSRAFLDGEALTLPDADVRESTITNTSPNLACQFLNGAGPAYVSNAYLDALILTRGEQ